MWWKVTLGVLLLSVLFAILGIYAGGALYLYFTDTDPFAVTWHTMLDAWLAGPGVFTFDQENTDLMYLPWCFCVAIAMTFLPLVLTIVALFAGKRVSDFHGSARFANDRELKLFEYKGEYR